MLFTYYKLNNIIKVSSMANLIRQWSLTCRDCFDYMVSREIVVYLSCKIEFYISLEALRNPV